MSTQEQELAALKMRVDLDHEPRPMGCKCGARFGDSIDARCHLINQTVEAILAAGYKRERDHRAEQDELRKQVRG